MRLSGVVVVWPLLLFPRSPLPTPKCRRFAAVVSGTRLRAQSLGATGLAAGRPIRGRQSGSGGKKQVKSVLHPPTHESSPSRADSRKFQQDRGPRENPAKRFSWGEDERRNERAFGVSRKRGIWRLRGRGPATNADADSTSQGLLLGPPYHKQIRHTVPFCAQAPFLFAEPQRGVSERNRRAAAALSAEMTVHGPFPFRRNRKGNGGCIPRPPGQGTSLTSPQIQTRTPCPQLQIPAWP